MWHKDLTYPAEILGISLIPQIDFGVFYSGYSWNIYLAHMACLWTTQMTPALPEAITISMFSNLFKNFGFWDNGMRFYNIFLCGSIREASSFA